MANRGERQAWVEVFVLAFRSLSDEEQQEVIGRLLEDTQLREAAMGIAIVIKRLGEPSRPTEEYLNAKCTRTASSKAGSLPHRFCLHLPHSVVVWLMCQITQAYSFTRIPAYATMESTYCPAVC